MNAIVPLRIWSAVAAIAAVALLAQPAAAQDASEWVRDTHSAVRLLAGSRHGNILLGGLEFELQNGWKTYWRTPGDSGVPPRFDFSKSDNVETVTPLFPAPIKFADGAGGMSYGYKKHLILPLRIVAKDADKPMVLRLSLSYAVCEKLCLPVEAHLELPFTNAVSTADTELRAALNTVPKPVQIGEGAPFAISGVTREGNRVLVDIVKPQATDVELFVEGPTPQWALPEPKAVEKSGDRMRFAFDLDGLPSDARAEGSTLKFTLVGAGNAYEYGVTLN